MECNRCKKNKLETEFHICKKAVNGREGACKACRALRKAEMIANGLSQNAVKRPRATPPTKRCSTCNRLKRSALFSEDLRNSDGLYHCCRKCKSKKTKAYYASDPQRAKAWGAERHAAVYPMFKVTLAEPYIINALSAQGIDAASARKFPAIIAGYREVLRISHYEY